MQSSILEFSEVGVDGTIFGFAVTDCSYFLDGESADNSHCWYLGKEYTDYMNFDYSGEITDTLINYETCASTDFVGECLEVDCSNLGYNSDFSICDPATYEGNPVLDQLLEYMFSGEGYLDDECSGDYVTAGDLCGVFADSFEDGECECTIESDSFAIASCTEDCPTCFELNYEEDDECVMQSSILEFSEVGVDGTIFGFAVTDCSYFLDGESADNSHCWYLGKEYTDYMNFDYSGEITDTLINYETCASTDFVGECLEVDCSNLGYNSDFSICDPATYEGNPVLDQALEYMFSGEGYQDDECVFSGSGDYASLEEMCDDIVDSESGGEFQTKCECEFNGDDELTVTCENTCEECFEEEDGATNCWLRINEDKAYNSSSGLIRELNSYAKFTKGELDDSVYWTEDDESEFPTEVWINEVQCLSVTGVTTDDEDCLLIDCSNLGYSSDWNSCDESTYDGNEVASAVSKYAEDIGSPGECFDNFPVATPSTTPSLTPSLSPIAATASPSVASVTTTAAPVPATAAPVTTSAAPVTTTAAPVTTSAAPVTTSAAPSAGSFSLRTTILLPCRIISYVVCTYLIFMG